jgi:hypothetical protein
MTDIEEAIRDIVRDEMTRGAAALSKAQAEYLGGAPITEKTLEALVRRREIGFLKIGRATVFPVAALRDYVEKHTLQPKENPWGLTDAGMQRIRADRAGVRARTR